MAARIAVATCAPVHALGLDPEMPSVLGALDVLGDCAKARVWDDPTVDWATYDLVVVRSCWDNTERPAEFVAWARSVPRLANPVEVLTWNTDKTYLRELAELGCPVVETHWDPLTTADIGVVTDLHTHQSIEECAPDASQVRVARQVLVAIAELTGSPDLLFTRVDVVAGSDGSPLVFEVELTEPSLFLEHAGPQATDRFAAAIAARTASR